MPNMPKTTADGQNGAGSGNGAGETERGGGGNGFGSNGVGSSGDGVGHTMEFSYELHSPDFHTPEDLVQSIRGKLAHRLHKYERHVLAVVVHLRDINGPRGGEGISCHMEVRMPHLEPVNVEEHDHDLRAAVDRAIDRLTVVVGRHLDKAWKSPIERARRQSRDSKTT
jgi:ribosome-associated translation inhibitor RaiA